MSGTWGRIFGDTSRKWFEVGRGGPLICPVGTFISQFGACVGGAMFCIAIKCSNGTVIGDGNYDASYWGIEHSGGFSRLLINYVYMPWGCIGGIVVSNGSATSNNLLGYFPGVLSEFACPSGQVLTGVRALTGSPICCYEGRSVCCQYLTTKSLQFLCTAVNSTSPASSIPGKDCEISDDLQFMFIFDLFL